MLALFFLALAAPALAGDDPAVPPAPEPAAKPAERDPNLELPAGDLPKPKEPASSSTEPAPFRSAREFFNLRGVDESFLRFLTDGQPFAAGERETVYKVLDGIAELSPYDQHQFRKEATPQQLAEKPADYRIEIVNLPLRVKQVDVVPLPAELGAKLDFKSYFQVRGHLAGKPNEEVIVFARRVPKAWEELRLGQPLDEAARIDGIFLKTGEKGKGELPQLYFVAERVEWLPDKPNPELGVPAAWLDLAQRGLDVSRFEDLHDKSKLGAQERECFYQFLNAVAHIPPAAIAQAAPAHSDLAPLVVSPAKVRGQLVTIEGTCRRATKIMVTDPDIQARFGIKHYYELIVFLDERVQFQQPGAPEKTVDFSTYPVVCCVLELPPEITTEGESREHVRVTGYYFKLYAYASQFMHEAQQKLGLASDLQLSPLIIGQKPTWIPGRKAETNPWIAASIAGATVLICVVGAIGAWQYHPPAVDRSKEAVGPIGPPK